MPTGLRLCCPCRRIRAKSLLSRGAPLDEGDGHTVKEIHWKMTGLSVLLESFFFFLHILGRWRGRLIVTPVGSGDVNSDLGLGGLCAWGRVLQSAGCGELGPGLRAGCAGGAGQVVSNSQH